MGYKMRFNTPFTVISSGRPSSVAGLRCNMIFNNLLVAIGSVLMAFSAAAAPSASMSVSASASTSCSASVPGLSSGQTSIPDSLTLEQAVSLTMSTHPALAQAREGVAAAEARVRSSRSSSYPDLSLYGAYTRIGPVSTMELPYQEPIKLAPENNYDVHLGLRETLYDFGRNTTSVKLAQSGRQVASDYVEQVKSNLAYRTIAAFNSILILRRSVAVLDEELEALDQHLDVSRSKVRAGTATDFDVLTTQVRIAAVRNERIDAANTLESQEILLRQLTGLPPDQPVRLKGDFDRVTLSLASDSLSRAALQQRPEMITSRDAENSASLQVRLSSLGDKPSLALSLTSGFKNGYFAELNTAKANFSAGAQLQFPIFNGNRTRHQRNEAEANLRSTRARTEDLERQIIADVQQATAGAKAGLEKIDNAEVQVRQSEEAVSMAKIKYEAGVVTNLDLLDTQTTLTQARLNYLRALYNYTVSLVAVDRATGKKVW
ncbi:MAG: TolC family protein [Candidatus Eisenbacteria bacterium]|nr:TolC family protein [Candidatus Eisenbacteria bacterium]